MENAGAVAKRSNLRQYLRIRASRVKPASPRHFRGLHSPLKTGGRFSRNDRTPSS